jgi:predicted transcriptional regulator
MNEKGLETLFFNLSSKSRIDILLSLSKENLRMNEIARRNDITATEASRQIQRLLDDAIISKQPDGVYTLTSYGKLFLHFFPPIEFIAKYQGYFLNHDIWRLPGPFISRLGELNSGVLSEEIAEVIDRIENMMRSAEQYVWVLTDQAVNVHNDAMIEQVSKGIKFRSLIHERMLKTSQLKIPPKSVERRVMPSIPALVVKTEKEAFLSLLSMDGTMVPSGFFGNDIQFMGWIEDFYMYYWNRTPSIYLK